MSSKNELLSLIVGDGIDLKSRSIDLFGDIEEDIARRLTRAVTLLLHRDAHGPITIKIGSTGGEAYWGLYMYDFIRSLEVEVTTVACGYVMSAAVLPYLAGDIRKSYPNSTFMVHSVSSASKGKAHELSGDAKETILLNEIYCNILAEHTTVDQKRWLKLIKYEDYYLRKAEAKQLNLVTTLE